MRAEKLFTVAGTLSMMVMAIVLAVVFVSLIISCLGCIWFTFAMERYGESVMLLMPIP